MVVTVETSLSAGGVSVSSRMSEKLRGDGRLTLASAIDDARLGGNEHAGRGDGNLLELHVCRAVM